jgi:hypothetical protein
MTMRFMIYVTHLSTDVLQTLVTAIYATSTRAPWVSSKILPLGEMFAQESSPVRSTYVCNAKSFAPEMLQICQTPIEPFT